jgi:hypothetical protein
MVRCRRTSRSSNESTMRMVPEDLAHVSERDGPTTWGVAQRSTRFGHLKRREAADSSALVLRPRTSNRFFNITNLY